MPDACTPDIHASEGLPRSEEGAPVFAEPWQAQAFAIAVALHAKGIFTWGEWADALSRELHSPERMADASDYFDAWVAALGALLSARGIASAADIDALQGRWQRAAEVTPHGEPIRLENAG